MARKEAERKGQDPAQIVQMMLELTLREWEEQLAEVRGSNGRRLWRRRQLAAKMTQELRDNVVKAAYAAGVDGGKAESDFERWWSSRG